NLSLLKLKIWSGRKKPEKLLYEQQLLLFELAAEEYNLIRLDTMKLVSESFFVGFEFNTQAEDTFSVYYVERSLMQDNTAWAFYNQGWYPLYSESGYISAALDIELLTFDYYIPPNARPGEFPYAGGVNVYPNPATDHIQVLFKDVPSQPVQCKIYDLQGRLCSIVNRIDPSSNFLLNISNLKSGFYILSIQCEWGLFNFRVMICRR
ncbi:MAG: T9SS type A sorting domain-containing protein, partial [Bacteroidales bacterium]